MPPRHRLAGIVAAGMLLPGIACAAELQPLAASIDVPAKLYDDAFRLLSAGKQDEAEQTLGEAVTRHPTDQRLVFFLGVCARSRWMKREALAIFDHTRTLDPATPAGTCADLMIALDRQTDYAAVFPKLEALQEANPNDPLVLWCAAIACRELGKRGADRIYSEKGAAYYERLLKGMDPGPVLLHQTCANILSESLERHAEALPHRELAVKLEPAAWSYQGLANTLSYLDRYTEADAAYAKSVAQAPDNPTYLRSWAWSLERRQDFNGAFEKYRQATRVDPNYAAAWRGMANCAERLDRREEGLRYAEKARALENGAP